MLWKPLQFSCLQLPLTDKTAGDIVIFSNSYLLLYFIVFVLCIVVFIIIITIIIIQQFDKVNAL